MDETIKRIFDSFYYEPFLGWLYLYGCKEGQDQTQPPTPRPGRAARGIGLGAPPGASAWAPASRNSQKMGAAELTDPAGMFYYILIIGHTERSRHHAHL